MWYINMPRHPATLLSDYHLLAYDELDSTNEEAKRLAHKGESHGAVIWAKRQTHGRGRMDRVWESREGNLFVSFLLSPGCDIPGCAELGFVAALAVRDAVLPVLPASANVQFKWPNDLLLGGRKAGGILIETFTQTNGALWAIVGVGLNVDSAPADARFPATCLTSEGVELISAKIVLSRFIHHFVERYNQWTKKGLGPLRKEWLKHAWRFGEQVRVALPNEELTGIFKDMEPGGSLVLALAGGRQQVIPAGDLLSLRAEEKAG